MSGWKAKRFWKAAAAVEVDGGFSVQLDGRAVKTPAKAAFLLPSAAMAEAAAAEWDAQKGAVRPETMPVTRSANSAIDKLSVQFETVVDLLAAYGASDLLCYRAVGPAELIARQAEAWDPLLDWAAAELAAPLRVTQGIVHIEQPGESLIRLRALVAGLSAFELAAFHDLVAISGSLILGFAVVRGRVTADEAFAMSRIDETWQAELWGIDEDAAILEASKKRAMQEAARFHELCG